MCEKRTVAERFADAYARAFEIALGVSCNYDSAHEVALAGALLEVAPPLSHVVLDTE